MAKKNWITTLQSAEKSCFLKAWVANGPLKNEKSQQILTISLEISHNLLMGLGVSDFVSVGHIYAFLSSH